MTVVHRIMREPGGILFWPPWETLQTLNMAICSVPIHIFHFLPCFILLWL